MSDTPLTDQAERKAIACMNHSGALKILVPKCRGLEKELAGLREALESVLDWSPKLEDWESKRTKDRFDADMQKARETLAKTGEGE